MRYFRFLALITFFLFSFGQIGRISFMGQNVNVYFYEIVLGMFFMYLIFRLRLSPLTMAKKSDKPLLFFILTLAITFILSLGRFNLEQNVVAFLYWLRLIFYLLFGIYIKKFIEIEPGGKSAARLPFRLFLVMAAAFSIGQYLLVTNLRPILYMGWDPHDYRMFGTFFDTAIASAIYGLVFLHLLNKLSDKGWKHMVNFDKIMLLFYGVFSWLSYSRTLYLSLIIVVLLMAVLKKNWKYLLVIFIVSAAGLLLLPKKPGEGIKLNRFYTIESRKEDYLLAWNIFRKEPILGIGYNHIRYSKEKYTGLATEADNHAAASFHSSFANIAVTTGIIGLLAYLTMLANCGKNKRINMILILFLSLLSLTDNILLHPFVLFLTTVLFSGALDTLDKQKQLKS